MSERLSDERIDAIMAMTSDHAMHVRDIPDVHAALSELRDLRAMKKRLEEWAGLVDRHKFAGLGPFIAAELRRRMEGP